MTELQTFREETKIWLEANCPPEMRKPGDVAWGGRNAQYSHPDQKLWLERMGEKGWTCPTWPSEYGGGGSSPRKAASPSGNGVGERLHALHDKKLDKFNLIRQASLKNAIEEAEDRGR